MDKGAAIKINLDQLLARVRDAQFKHLTKNPSPMQHILESERERGRGSGGNVDSIKSNHGG